VCCCTPSCSSAPLLLCPSASLLLCPSAPGSCSNPRPRWRSPRCARVLAALRVVSNRAVEGVVAGWAQCVRHHGSGRSAWRPRRGASWGLSGSIAGQGAASLKMFAVESHACGAQPQLPYSEPLASPCLISPCLTLPSPRLALPCLALPCHTTRSFSLQPLPALPGHTTPTLSRSPLSCPTPFRRSAMAGIAPQTSIPGYAHCCPSLCLLCVPVQGFLSSGVRSQFSSWR